MKKGEFSRRGALKYFGLLAASAAGRTFLASWLPIPLASADGQKDLTTIHGTMHSRAHAEAPGKYIPQFFKPEQFATVKVLAEIILPTDDEPGANEAKVADYIDFVIFSAREFEPSMQREWIDGLAFLDSESQKQFGKPFHSASATDRVRLLTEMSLPERDLTAHHEGYSFFRLVKDMTVEGFYTSQVGLIDVLNYQGMNYMAEFPGCTHPEHQS
jgi:gluconate 2-dehydrogenase subunit 3-like protein